VPDSAEKTVRDIRRATRRHHSAEEKIRMVLEGLRGEDSIAELCRKEGINQNLYYRWSNKFLEAGSRKDVSSSASQNAASFATAGAERFCPELATSQAYRCPFVRMSDLNIAHPHQLPSL
jgi:transposase-like protein